LGFVPQLNLRDQRSHWSDLLKNSGPATIIADGTIGHNSFTEDVSFIGDKIYCSQEVSGIEGTAPVSYLKVTLPQISSSKINSHTAIEFNKLGSFQISPDKYSSINTGTPETCITQVGFTEISSDQLATVEIGTGQVGTGQVGTGQICPVKYSSTQVRPIQIGSNQFDSDHFGVGKINIPQISQNQIGVFNSNSTEIPFSRSVEFKQFFSIHDSKPEIINEINNSSTNSDSFGGQIIKPEAIYGIKSTNAPLTNIPYSLWVSSLNPTYAIGDRTGLMLMI
jgi:hypothetical protein